jgi:hypothetical protein
MAYLGNAPARSFISFERQVFTIVNSQTAYTLSHSVVNENDIRLVINNVVQEPGSGKAYTASGTTLTLSAALTNGTDEMYCVFLGRAVGTVNAPNASVGSDQTAPTIITGQTAETSIATDDTILIHDTSASALRKMTRANFVSGIGGDNTPAWKATNSSSSQSISHDSTTKLTFTEEVFDTDSAYDATNSKFVVPSGEGGKYLISMKYEMEVLTNPTYAYIYVNGSVTSATRFKASSYSNEARMIVTLSAGDYVEGYTYQASGGSVNVLGLSGARGSVFEGFKLIGV